MENAEVRKLRDECVRLGFDEDEVKEFQDAFHKLVSRAWEDEPFKAALKADPVKVCQESGIVLPVGTDPQLIERIPTCGILEPPPHYFEEELTDEELAHVVGGGDGGCDPGCQAQRCATMMMIGFQDCEP